MKKFLYWIFVEWYRHTQWNHKNVKESNTNIEIADLSHSEPRYALDISPKNSYISKYYTSTPIEAEDIWYKYDNKTYILKGLTAKIQKGCLGLIGQNGAGKTTLFNILSTHLLGFDGSLEIEGVQLNSESVRQVRRLIGYCNQFDNYYDYLTVEQHLYYVLELRNVQRNYHTLLIDQILSKIDLTKYRLSLAKDLSGGNKRKLCFAIALIHKPSVLLLDEPTASMDPISRKQINEIIYDYSKQNTLIYCSHLLDEVEDISNNIMFLAKGRVKYMNSPAQIKQNLGTSWILSINFNTCQDDKLLQEQQTRNEQKATLVDKIECEFTSNNINFSNVGYSKNNELNYYIEQKDLPKTVEIVETTKENNKFMKSYIVYKPSLEELFWVNSKNNSTMETI